MHPDITWPVHMLIQRLQCLVFAFSPEICSQAVLLSSMQAFDASGRQPGSFIAQAVVDVAAMLQEGSLNASAALVNRKGWYEITAACSIHSSSTSDCHAPMPPTTTLHCASQKHRAKRFAKALYSIMPFHKLHMYVTSSHCTVLTSSSKVPPPC